MTDNHPDQHFGYELRVAVVQLKEVYKNKEDSHGGPGYYPAVQTLVNHTHGVTEANLPHVIEKVATGNIIGI